MSESNKVIKTGLAYVYDDDDEADDEDSRGDLLTKNANIRLRLAAARAEVERLRGIIRKAEWIGYNCEICYAEVGSDHAEYCPFYQWEGGAQ